MTIQDSLFCTDARRFLLGLEPDSVDLILTDPPYQVSIANGDLPRKEASPLKRDFGRWDKEPLDCEGFAAGAAHCLRDGGSVLVFCGDHLMWEVEYALRRNGIAFYMLLYWLKSNPPPKVRPGYLSEVEPVIWAFKVGENAATRPTFNGRGGYHRKVLQYPIVPAGQRWHPTQKPVEMLRELVMTHSNEGDLVVDPYCGSGSTLVAAAELGRRYAGCDADPDWTTCASNRLMATTPPLPGTI